MSAIIGLFANLPITADYADQVRNAPVADGWLSVGVTVSDVAGTNPAASFHIQWSFDNITWTDAHPDDLIGSATAPSSMVELFQVKAPYWRLYVTVTGTLPSLTCTANAMV